jgi:hypothetical protein
MKKLLFGLLFVFAINVVSFASQPVISILDNEISLSQEQEKKVEKKKCDKDCTKECCTKEAKAEKKACCTKEAKAEKCDKAKKCDKAEKCTKEAKAEKKCDANCTKECCKKS